MISALLLVAALTADEAASPQSSAPSAASQQTVRPQILPMVTPPGDLVLEIAVARYEPTDRRTSHASINGSAEVATTFFMTDTCSVGAGRVNYRTMGGAVQGGGHITFRDPDSVGGLRLHTAWEASGRVVDRTPYGLAVAIDWRRVTQDGREIANGPSGSMQVTIRAGERLTLDTVSPPPGSTSVPCTNAAAIRLEAAVVSRTERTTVTGVRGGRGGGGRGGGGGGAGAVAGGSGAAVAGGTGGAVAGSSRGGAAGGRGAGASGGRGRAGGAGASQTGARRTVEEYYRVLNTRRLNVELWLVHGRPNQEEAVQRVNVRTAGPTNFGFPTIALGTSDGASFEVNGQIQVVPDAVVVNGQPVPDSARRVSVFIQRRIFTTADPRGTAWSTTKIIEMPAAADVVEFELPPLEGEAYKGHRLSLRLRITQ